ncbi:MAG: hypothetical protein ACI9TH_000474 [Kiritimatiellia bacterium]
MGLYDRDYMRGKGSADKGGHQSPELKEALNAARGGWQKEDHLLNRYGPSKFRKWVMIIGLVLIGIWVVAMLWFKFG